MHRKELLGSIDKKIPTSVGVFGGSFNPIHNGHIGIAEQICQLQLVDEVWFMVSPLNPLKQTQQQDLLPDFTRLQLARLATAGHPNLHVSDFETHLPIPSYTVTTLTHLRHAFPNVTFSLIIGEDNWNRFSQWYQPEEIRAHHDIIVYGRNAIKDIEAHPQFCTQQTSFIAIHRTDNSPSIFSNLPYYNISSTAIRQALHFGNYDFAHQHLPESVFCTICEQKLYEPSSSSI